MKKQIEVTQKDMELIMWQCWMKMLLASKTVQGEVKYIKDIETVDGAVLIEFHAMREEIKKHFV